MTNRVWLWLDYKLGDNNCCLQLFAKLIQTQKRYTTFLGKISILSWKPLLISNQIFVCELNSSRALYKQSVSCLLQGLKRSKMQIQKMLLFAVAFITAIIKQIFLDYKMLGNSSFSNLKTYFYKYKFWSNQNGSCHGM